MLSALRSSYGSVLGWSSFVGVAVVLFAYLITWPLAKWSIRVRAPLLVHSCCLWRPQITRSSWAAKDYRMSLVSELFQSIRFLKYMGWGKPRNCKKPQTDLTLMTRVSLDKKGENSSRNRTGVACQGECLVHPDSVSQILTTTFPQSQSNFRFLWWVGKLAARVLHIIIFVKDLDSECRCSCRVLRLHCTSAPTADCFEGIRIH